MTRILMPRATPAGAAEEGTVDTAGTQSRGKYGAVRTERHGIRFASRKEADRYDDLLLLERAGEIRDLQLQPRYRLEIGGHLICTYVGDFEYVDVRTGLTVTEDSKGVRTREYILKKKLMRALLGIEIVEV